MGIQRGEARKGGLLPRGAWEHDGIPAETGPRDTKLSTKYVQKETLFWVKPR